MAETAKLHVDSPQLANSPSAKFVDRGQSMLAVEQAQYLLRLASVVARIEFSMAALHLYS
jgi:hypothetical protein